MRTELSFLMDIFLDEEIPIKLKKMIADRIREVEAGLTQPVVSRGTPLRVQGVDINGSSGIVQQAPSMQRIIDAHPDVSIPVMPVSPAAAQALQQRQQAILSGMKEKPEPGRTSPRKF